MILLLHEVNVVTLYDYFSLLHIKINRLSSLTLLGFFVLWSTLFDLSLAATVYIMEGVMLLFPQHHFEETLLISTLADFPTIADNILLFYSLSAHLILFSGFCLCKVDHIKTLTVHIIVLKSPTGYGKFIIIRIKLSPGIYKMFS